eukprot:10823611-Ditylum_brightwellii.AAC.1
MAFVGTDPDTKVNDWLYDQDEEKYLGNSRKLKKSWGHKMGPKKAQEACITYKKGTKFDGLTGIACRMSSSTLIPSPRHQLDLLKNFDWSGKYHLNSISDSLYQDLLKKVSANITGPEVQLAIQACVGQYTYGTVEKVKAKLKAIKLSDYPGENIQTMNIAIKAKCDQLDSAGYKEKDSLHAIAE